LSVVRPPHPNKEGIVKAHSANHKLTMPDGTTFVVVESGAENGGARMEFEITMAPDAMGPPRHTHPTQEESWTVVAGELSVFVDGDWRSLSAGESLTISPGTVHTLKNRSQETVRFRDVHAPALDFQEYIENLDRLRASGKLSSRMTPRTLIYGAMVLVDHRPMQLSASAAQRTGESLLAMIGRLLGYRPRS
jgi:quercetin dioxygenase-like cupin family protein